MKRSLDSLTAWRIFLSLCETGSVSLTADALNLQPSQVSRAVSGLEALTGAVLFDRSKRPLIATPRGREVEARLRPVMTQWDLFGDFLERPPERHTAIRLSTPVGIGRFYLNAQIAEYAKVDPLALIDATVEKGVEELLAGEIDVAFVPYSPANGNLFVHPAMNAFTLPLASPLYIEKHGMPLCPEDLVRHTGFLKTGNHFPEADHLVLRSEKKTAFWKRAVRYSDMLNIKDAVLRGYGIAVDIPLGMVLEELRRKELVPVLGGWHRDFWHYSVVTRAADAGDTPVGRFAAWYAARATREIDERRREGFRLLGIDPAAL